MREIGIIKQHGDEHVIAYRVLDIAIIIATILMTANIYADSWNIYYLLATSVAVVSFSVMAELLGVYNPSYTSSLRQTLPPILLSWFCAIGLLLVLAFGFKITDSFSRIAMTVWFVGTPVLLTSYRLVSSKVRTSAKSDSYEKKSIIIGATPAGLALAKEIQSSRHHGLNLVGIFDDRSLDRLADENLDVQLRGSINDALQMAKERDFRHVYVALPMKASNRIKEVINYFADSTARVYIVPDFFTYDLIQSRWRNVGNIPTLSIHDTPFYGMSTFVKRLEDIVVSALILLLISPVLLAVSIGVKLSSPGPIIFKQHRYGIDGKQIKVWKFRSMRSMDNGQVVKQATKGDPRITKFGAFIRKTSLDELPQFINVLQGRMSIVGPRPHAVSHNEEYRQIVDRYMLRHKVKPGITGWAQINGYRGETDTVDKMEKRVEYDLTYIREWSLWLDIKIIFLTIFKGFIGKAAY
ncbi:UDP-glucose:undecaprenyl-phosphate glucose-1-phosphate transferase [Vibrio scophthalmi]|uniref:UDP-glucose:undecaprenyl-phosphate glucose-1-phosphate transferase n=1 Tax=Vibrio scophthalmi TaxID=45658 RepID=A0A1B1NVY4_9VIBR|nr:undecaprenyl-phosphate glucose phosphotransferase [Vibrio scophthalmi]ANS87826.1 UDP-glucose:undecaprenyl-phosphate glucose-1-phosphate transferase [Vibrio scophthalmi]ANU38629.1 UDP-glucose:undecaprenyl-phosphate glucose-1-phosphate transferase [Vibrio scophthalmi]